MATQSATVSVRPRSERLAVLALGATQALGGAVVLGGIFVARFASRPA